LEPSAPEPWAGFGALLIALERYEEALRSLDHALANDIDPKEPRTYKLKAEALRALGRTAEAEVAAAEASRLEQVHAAALADDGPDERAHQDNNA
jgi:Flp pilus assembly protein TadD